MEQAVDTGDTRHTQAFDLTESPKRSIYDGLRAGMILLADEGHR
jgi:hypothetical protein